MFYAGSAAVILEDAMVSLIALFFVGVTAPRPCAHPAAGDANSTRRIAEAVLRKMHARRFHHETGRPDRAYVLRVIRAPFNPSEWWAFQALNERNMRGGGGLEFRIDRCTGVVSDIHYGR